MATVIVYNTARSMVISLLQASATAYATTVDGSNRQYASSTEIDNAILTADGEICTLIASTMGSPFQTAFIIGTPATITGPSGNLPSRNGAILKVQCQGAPATATFLNSAINTTTDIITVTAHGMITGQPITYTCSATVPAGLTSGNTYYIIRQGVDTLSLASSSWNAFQGTKVNITSQGTAGNTSTLTSNYLDGTAADSKDTIVQATQNVALFAGNAYGAAGFFFIEGDQIYTTSPNVKVTYTDYILTSTPQAPEPYLHAVVAGAVCELLKDGGDSTMAGYYQAQYQSYLQQIASGTMMIPAIQAYQGAQ